MGRFIAITVLGIRSKAMKIEIKSRWDSNVLFSIECGSLKLALEAAVKSGADL